MSLTKEQQVKAEEKFHQLHPDNYEWLRFWSNTVQLDGDYTVDQLRSLADLLEGKGL